MKQSLISCIAVIVFSQSSRAQYFLTPNPSVSTAAQAQFQVTTSQFEEKKKVTRQVYDNELVFVPAKPVAGVTLQEMEKGFLLGKLTTDKTGSLGTSRQQKLQPGTYYIWLVRQNRVWTIVATDQNGILKATTHEVTLHMDKEDTSRFFSKIMPHFMIPPYAMVDEKGKILPAADEGPGTVHGCRCWTVWTTIDDPNKPGRGTTCWPYTRCSCW